MKIQTIDADIQEEILEILPCDYKTALELIAQLSANMCLSGNKFDVEEFCDKVRKHHDAYIEAGYD